MTAESNDHYRPPTVGGRRELPDRSQVVVIGGGVMGTSIAFHLAEAGIRDVVVLESDQLGRGSSAKPLGGVRATFSDPGNIALGQRSLEAYERFDATFGTDIGLRQVGYLFLASTDVSAAQLATSTALQQSLGGSSRMIDVGEALQLNPLLDPTGFIAASFSPRDGYAQPAAVVAAYAQAATDLGAVVLEGVPVRGIEVDAGAVRAVQTSVGTIRTEAVVCAAGAWSQAIGAMAGLSLPVEPVRRQIGLTAQHDPPFPTVPFTLDLDTTLYFHNYADGMLLGISNADQAPGFSRDVDRQWVPAFDAAARRIAPSLVARPLVGGWAGLYENTPDHNAIIGISSTVNGFYYATGFSGHGFLQAPAVGEVIRDLYLGRPPGCDISAFTADRFAGVIRRTEVHII